MAPQVSKLVLLICFVQVAEAGLAVRLFSVQSVSRVTAGADAIAASSLVKRRTFAAPVRLQVGGRTLVSRFPVTIERSGGELAITLDIPAEEYVAAVLAGEVGYMRKLEVLKAMAVAARTYAVRFPTRHRAQGYNLCDTTHCQDLRLIWDNPLIERAVEETDREVLWYKGRPAATYYSQNCGGQGESAGWVWQDQSMPYLQGRPDPFCPAKPWRAELQKSDLSRALARNVHTLQVVSRTDSGRALELDLGGFHVRAAAFRMLLGRTLGWALVRSDWYDTQDTGRSIEFLGRGGGHGVGMCQQGAERMAAKGRTYRDILKQYYPGTEVGVSAQGIGWKYLSGERVRLATTNPGADQALIPLGDSLVKELETRMGMRFAQNPQLRVYPTVAVFRDATGEPGWVAASARGNTIRLQSATRGPGLLRHELLHLLIESESRGDLPRWYREGLTLSLTQAKIAESATAPGDRAFAASPRQAYRQAQGFVQRLIRLRGEQEVVSWSKRGLPPELQARLPETTTPSPQLPRQGSSGLPD